MSITKKRLLESLVLHQENGRILASATYLDGYWSSETDAWDSEPKRTSVAYDSQHDGDADVITSAVGDMVTKMAAGIVTAQAEAARSAKAREDALAEAAEAAAQLADMTAQRDAAIERSETAQAEQARMDAVAQATQVEPEPEEKQSLLSKMSFGLLG